MSPLWSSDVTSERLYCQQENGSFWKDFLLYQRVLWDVKLIRKPEENPAELLSLFLLFSFSLFFFQLLVIKIVKRGLAFWAAPGKDGEGENVEILWLQLLIYSGDAIQAAIVKGLSALPFETRLFNVYFSKKESSVSWILAYKNASWEKIFFVTFQIAGLHCIC